MSPRLTLRELATALAAGLFASLLLWLLHVALLRGLLQRMLARQAEHFGQQPLLRWRLEEGLAQLPDIMVAKLLLLAWALGLLALLVYACGWRAAQSRWPSKLALGVVSLLVCYYSVESFVAPFMIKRLDLFYFYSVLDTDHRMPRSMPAIPTNSDGIRSRREAGEFEPDDLNIVFLGDSFTFGQHVDVEQAFPALVERFLDQRLPARKVRVANFGWTSSSPYLSARLLADIGERYHPELVVMSVDMTDFFEEILYPSMVERRGLYWFYDKLPITLNLLRKYAPDVFWALYRRLNHFIPEQRFFATERPLDETREQLGRLVKSLDRLDRISHRLGARLVVFVLPRSYQYSAREVPDNTEAHMYTVLGPYSREPFRFFDEQRQQVDYPIVSLLDVFTDSQVFPTCFDDDPHWNPAGHELAAAAMTWHLESLLREP